MRRSIQHWNETKELDDPMIGGGDIGSLAFGLFIFADLVQTHDVYDFKLRINDYIGDNVRISRNWYRYDVPGNLHYGFLGSDIGISEKLLLCGGDIATNSSWCSGSDDPSDKQAIKAGVALQKNSQGRDLDKNILNIILSLYGLSKRIPSAPPQKSPIWGYGWPYRVGTFDDGSSGIIFRHRPL